MKRFALLVLLIFGCASAQYDGNKGETTSDAFSSNVGFHGIAGKLALLLVSSDYGVTPGFGLWTDLGYIAKNVGVDAGIEYWNAGREKLEAIERKTDLAIYATVRYDIEIGKIRPFLGGGIGVNMYTKKYPDEWNRPDEKDTKPELHIDMGARYNVHPKIDLEARIKANFSDVSAYGLHVSGIFLTEK